MGSLKLWDLMDFIKREGKPGSTWKMLVAWTIPDQRPAIQEGHPNNEELSSTKYHLKYVTKFRRQFRTFVHNNSDKNQNTKPGLIYPAICLIIILGDRWRVWKDYPLNPWHRTKQQSLCQVGRASQMVQPQDLGWWAFTIQLPLNIECCRIAI